MAECTLWQSSTMGHSRQTCVNCWKESSSLQALRGAWISAQVWSPLYPPLLHKQFFFSPTSFPRSHYALLGNRFPDTVIRERPWDDIFLFSPDRPDCVGGRLCFVFYSSLKNLKEVYICPAQGQKGPVRGQVRRHAQQIRKCSKTKGVGESFSSPLQGVTWTA